MWYGVLVLSIHPPGEGLARTVSCQTGLWFGNQLYEFMRLTCIAECDTPQGVAAGVSVEP